MECRRNFVLAAKWNAAVSWVERGLDFLECVDWKVALFRDCVENCDPISKGPNHITPGMGPRSAYIR